MRADAATVLIAMGFGLTDFVAQDRGQGTEIVWLSVKTMPSEATINAFDLVAAKTALLHSLAKLLIDAVNSDGVRFRAFVLVLLDALNRDSKQYRDLLAAIAAATSLANLQARAAAITPVEPARTVQELIDAIKTKIDAGSADS